MFRATTRAVGACVVSLVLFAQSAHAQGAGESIGVERAGSGPVPVVLLPGMASDGSVWRTFMERNAQRYTMYAVTLPGFGNTPPPPPIDEAARTTNPAGTPYLDYAVARVSSLIEAEKLEKPVIVGHSLGAIVAMRVALDRPEFGARVVAVDALPYFPMGGGNIPQDDRIFLVESEIRPQLLQFTDEQWQAQQRSMAPNVVEDPGVAARLADMFCVTPVGVAVEYWLEQIKTDLTPRLGDLKSPLLAMVSIETPMDAPMLERDPVRAMHEEAFAPAPQGAIVYFDFTRHFIMLDRPAEFDRALELWLKGEPVPPFPPPGVGAPGSAGAQEPK